MSATAYFNVDLRVKNSFWQFCRSYKRLIVEFEKLTYNTKNEVNQLLVKRIDRLYVRTYVRRSNDVVK